MRRLSLIVVTAILAMCLKSYAEETGPAPVAAPRAAALTPSNLKFNSAVTKVPQVFAPSGQALTADGAGKSFWAYILGTNISSGQASNGMVLAADGAGKANWVTPSAPPTFTGSLSGDVTGTQSATVVANVGGVTAANVAATVSTVTAASQFSTPNTLALRDGSGNFTANVITATLSGNVTGGTVNGTTGTFSGALNVSTAFTVEPRPNNTGVQNTFISKFAGTANTTGIKNVFIGEGAGLANTSGSFNSAVGFEAFNKNTIGGANTGMGVGALFSNLSGNNNVGFGTQTLNGNSTGSQNVAVGASALSAVTSASNNVAVGFQALNTNNGSNNIALGNTAGTSLTSGSNNIYIGNSGVATESNTIRLGTSGTHTSTLLVGNMGLNCSPTKAMFEINGTAGTVAIFQNASYGNTGVPSAGNSGGGTITSNSLYASGDIMCSVYRAISDQRVKRVAGRSDAARDLTTLLAIEITDYTYIDAVTKGAGKQKKVIAQQVEQVYPQAVAKHTDVVPDIYKMGEHNNGWVELATDLKTGDRVRLIGDKKDGVYEVLEVQAGKFRTAFKTESKQVFVFGREVNDFRTVDYEALAMLNVSATQAIKKEKDAENKALREENTELKKRLAQQEVRLARIEKALGAEAQVAIPASFKAK